MTAQLKAYAFENMMLSEIEEDDFEELNMDIGFLFA